VCDVSVVIPSYGRPRELRRCLEALDALTPHPMEILVVLRPDDESSRLVAVQSGMRVRVVDVTEPGHLPPLSVALSACRGQVMAVLDDDAVPRASWLWHIQQAFSDPGVVGLGGPVADHSRRPAGNQGMVGVGTALHMRLFRGRTVYRGFRALPDPRCAGRRALKSPCQRTWWWAATWPFAGGSSNAQGSTTASTAAPLSTTKQTWLLAPSVSASCCSTLA